MKPYGEQVIGFGLIRTKRHKLSDGKRAANLMKKKCLFPFILVLLAVLSGCGQRPQDSASEILGTDENICGRAFLLGAHSHGTHGVQLGILQPVYYRHIYKYGAENLIASPGSGRPMSKEEVVEIIMKCK